MTQAVKPEPQEVKILQVTHVGKPGGGGGGFGGGPFVSHLTAVANDIDDILNSKVKLWMMRYNYFR